MACFPYPRDTDVESIRVPLIARTQYAVTRQPNFLKSFIRELDAETQKVKAAESGAQESTSYSPSHMLASAIQSWLFFGIASEALGRNIRHEEFADADPNGPHLSIDLRIPQWYWRELKARWDELDDSLTAAEFEAKRVHLKKIYKSAHIVVICMDFLANGLDNDKLTKILLSIHMLLYLVAHVLDDSDTLKVTQTTTSSASTKLLKRRMAKNGWCEKRLNFLDVSPMAYPTFYFLSSLKPPRISAEDHSSCSSERCLVTSKLSKPLHRTDECLCENVVVPVDRMNAIAASGGIPLVRITRSPLGKTELEVVPYTSSARFVAISHVWADQQFGSAQNCLPKCQVGYLEEVLSSLPTSIDHWGLREWVANWRSSRPGEIAPPSRAYQYFWLDSFCIPQAVEHADLRNNAIESMNLIYAAASHTFVFDKGLQALDAGQSPASLALGGRPTYFSPREENLLDVVASIYASNWMGRAWTLQEGILSGRIVFPFHGSLAYLELLRPRNDDGFGGFWEFLVTRIPKDFRRSARDLLPRRSKGKTEVSKRLQDESEPFRQKVHHQLYTHMSESLYVAKYKNYARTPADRAANFVKAHSLLQSRTTTQAEDIPLILMNMSCMNANAISQSKTIDARMKQLFYGLESLPTELLFSDCARLGLCSVDAWIPREIAPESFKGMYTLKLGSAGFTFETRKGAQALKFYLLSSAHRLDRFRLLLPVQKDAKIVRYDVEALQKSNDEQPAAPTRVWCIVVNNEPPKRGARFVVNRVVGNKYFLHFDCPLRLTEIEDSKSPSDAQQDPKHECGAVRLNGGFIIERSHESQDLSISRPQHPEQYSDRLIVIGQVIFDTMGLGERYLMRAIWGDENSMGTLFFTFYVLYNIKKHQWVRRALNAFVHRAWIATYQPSWDPNGPWKWIWKITNWQPPIPFKTLMKWWCSLRFFLDFQAKSWAGVAMVTAYWLPLFPTRELMNLYITAILTKIVLSFFF